MRIIKIQRQLVFFLITALIFSLFPLPLHPIPTKAATDNLSNLVVFVDFADTVHEHSTSIWGSCFLEDPKIDSLFNDETAPRSLKGYLKNISYNQLTVNSIFPQYDKISKKITTIKLSKSCSYYTSAYPSTSDLIVSDVLTALRPLVNSDCLLDANNDGSIDNLMIVVPCESGNSNSLIYGLHSNYAGSEYINGKRVNDYTIITEGGAYLGINQSGLIIHEFMHTLGYRDLYRNRNSLGDVSNVPVYTWDIMSSESQYLQFPLAYERASVSSWFNMSIVTTNQTGYKLYSATATIADGASHELKDKQAVILKTPYSSSEFFVLEYRKKAPSRYESGFSEDNYDQKIPGSGLIIYRVNTGNPYHSNRSGDYYIYVFRHGDTYANGIEKAGGEFVAASYFPSSSGQNFFGQSDMSLGLSDDALTYSDGKNSGICISNISSAGGDTISFDISFPDYSTMSFWDNEAEYNSSNVTSIVPCMTPSGSIYSLFFESKGSSYAYSLYSLENGNWTYLGASPASKMNDASLCYFNNKLYCTYLSDSGLHLASWNSGRKTGQRFTAAPALVAITFLQLLPLTNCYSPVMETLESLCMPLPMMVLPAKVLVLLELPPMLLTSTLLLMIPDCL